MNSTTGENENSSSNSSNEDFYYNYYCCDPADLHYSYSDDSKTSTAVNQGAVLDSSLVVRDVDVEEYVRHVYGISQADLAYIHSKEWELDGLSAYTEQLDKGEKEDAFCEPFKNIMGNLFKTLVDDGRKLDIHHVSLGTKGREGAANVRNPDQLFFFGSHVDKMPIMWSLSKAFVEFVVTPKSQRLREFELSQKTGALGEGGTPTAGSAPDASIPDLLASPASTPSGTKRRHNSESYEPDNANQLRLAQSKGKNPVENPTTVEEPAAQRAALFKRRWAQRQSNKGKTSAPPLLAAATSIPDHAPRDDLDFETLGGCLTFENFMAALNGSEPVGIPEEYEEYAKSLLREPKQVDASGST
ncbi:hypothetical protein EYR40_010198 [Pleurotus pulmonarius]|nr:hypothetical protein EYR36_010405 [Pleurotus pulmonarius]KAF4588645.1 hypothetical protein EYR40_010198 [Pleurotus pulmonarius]